MLILLRDGYSLAFPYFCRILFRWRWWWWWVTSYWIAVFTHTCILYECAHTTLKHLSREGRCSVQNKRTTCTCVCVLCTCTIILLVFLFPPLLIFGWMPCCWCEMLQWRSIVNLFLCSRLPARLTVHFFRVDSLSYKHDITIMFAFLLAWWWWCYFPYTSISSHSTSWFLLND